MGFDALSRVFSAFSAARRDPHPTPQPTPQPTPGPNTRDEFVRNPTPTPSPSPGPAPVAPQDKYTPANEAAWFDYYTNLVKQQGGTFEGKPNEKYFVAVRRDTNLSTNGGRGAYDDTGALIWKDDRGQKHVRVYAFNTEPAGSYADDTHYAKDVNGDGRAEIGRIAPGNYTVKFHQTVLRGFGSAWTQAWRDGDPTKLNPFNVARQNKYFHFDDKAVPGEYDVDHDGDFDEHYRGDMTGLLIHAGDTDHVGSAGCNSMPPEQWDCFMSALGRTATEGQTLGYTVVQAAPPKPASHVRYRGREEY